MRRVQLVRRRKVSSFLFFVGFLWAGLGMGLDIKSGLIAKDFSVFLEKKLNTLFTDKEVRLSRVEGGMAYRKLAIDDFSICRKSNSSPIFSVDKIIINYNLLNLALRRFENLGGIYLVSPSFYFTPKQDVNFPLPQGASSYLSSASTYGGKPIKFHILNGNITALGRNPILKNLKGQVNFYNSNLRFNDLEGSFLNIPVLVNGRIDNVLEGPVIKLRLLARDKYYSATCTFKSVGQKGEALIWGQLRLFDRFEARFKGSINISSGEVIEIKKLVITQPFDRKSTFLVSGDIDISNRTSKFIIIPKTNFSSSMAGQAGCIKVISNISKDKGLSIYAKINHIDFLGHDVLSQIDINTNLYKPTDSQGEMLKGVLKTQTLILDYRPFKEIEASWILKKRELFITNFELGGVYRLFGKIKLTKPYDTDLNLSINNAELTDWLIFSNSSQPAFASGLVSGNIKIEGPLTAPLTNGRLNIKEGNINDIRFNAINFNLKGEGPILVISDSRIFKEGGFLYVDGEVDLRKFGKRNIFEDVKIRTDQKVIVWEGWDITKSPSQVTARKDLGEDFDVNFKTYVNTGNVDDDQKKSEIGLDYKIKKDDSINVRMKDDSAFVGVEHKIKF